MSEQNICDYKSEDNWVKNMYTVNACYFSLSSTLSKQTKTQASKNCSVYSRVLFAFGSICSFC